MDTSLLPTHTTSTVIVGIAVDQICQDEYKEPLTKTSRKNILLLRILANRQLIVQTELAIAIVAAQRAVCLCALGDCTTCLSAGLGFRFGVYLEFDFLLFPLLLLLREIIF